VSRYATTTKDWGIIIIGAQKVAVVGAAGICLSTRTNDVKH